VIDLLFLVLPDSLLLDLAGPAEAFRLANQALRRRGLPEAFRLRFAGPSSEITSSVGLTITALEPLPASLPAPTWVVLLGRPGDAPTVLRREREWLAARDWLAAVLGTSLGDPQSGHRLLTVCVGSLLAADAGLIGSREVTTHHELLTELERLAPGAQVRDNRVFVEDGPLLSSAGVTAGIDLALHCIAQVCGPTIASTVAQVMVVFARRGTHDPEQSPLLAGRHHLHPAVHRAQDAVCERPADEWTAQALAGVAHVSTRHLTRLFIEHVGVSPRTYVEQVRMALLQHALGRGLPAKQAAAQAGFGTDRQCRRARLRACAASGGAGRPAAPIR
jgi:transcriptional regulator GlxA family with amidase domain